MAAVDKCAGCTNKYKYFERPSICPECHKSFCQSCLPYEGKKVKKSQPQVSLEACVYCKRQKPINKAEEEHILDNFQERFYKKAHTEPPIQSSLRLDRVVRQNPSSNPGPGPPKPAKQERVWLSEEDKALEERLKKLKGSPKVSTPSYTEQEMREKLEHLRGEEKGAKEGGATDEGANKTKGNDSSTTTQSEQTDKLLEQATDEMRIDSHFNSGNQTTDEALVKRFQNLKDSGSDGLQQDGSKSKNTQPKTIPDIHQFLDNMDAPMIQEEDPEKLLRDLKALQHREEAMAIEELKSDGVQGLMKEAQKLAELEKEGEGSDDPLASRIVYPALADTTQQEETVPTIMVSDDTADISKAEVARMLEEGTEELEQERKECEANARFLEHTSGKLDQLRGDEKHVTSTTADIAEDEVVKSKPKSTTAASPNLEFSWTHYGSHIAAATTSTDSAAKQLGITDDRVFPSENGGEFDDEVQDLIARMLEEAELDRRLESSGLDYRRGEDSKPSAGPSDGPAAATAASAGATALPVGGGGRDYDPSELPWCCICNDDASICCYDCESDLYCKRCFAEGHKQFGLYNHQYVPFEPPKK